MASRVQAASNFKNTTGTSLVVGAAQGWAAPTVGHLIVAWFNGDSTCTTPAGFSAGVSVVDGNACYFYFKIADGTEASVTFAGLPASSPCTCGLLEYNGVQSPPLDQQNSSTIPSTVGTTTTAVSVTTTDPDGAIVVALAALHANGTVASTNPIWTNGFTNIQSVSDTTGSNTVSVSSFVAELITAAAGTVSTSCSWTNARSGRQELLIAFKTQTPADTTPPSAPSNLVATRMGAADADLSWTNSTDDVAVAGYEVTVTGPM